MRLRQKQSQPQPTFSIPRTQAVYCEDCDTVYPIANIADLTTCRVCLSAAVLPLKAIVQKAQADFESLPSPVQAKYAESRFFQNLKNTVRSVEAMLLRVKQSAHVLAGSPIDSLSIPAYKRLPAAAPQSQITPGLERSTPKPWPI
jgi:hypothetical protein